MDQIDQKDQTGQKAHMAKKACDQAQKKGICSSE